MLIEAPATPPEIAKLMGVKSDTVRAWISAGHLEAINLADPGSSRPRWRVMPEALDAFLQSRSSRLTATPESRRRRRKTITKPTKLKYGSL